MPQNTECLLFIVDRDMAMEVAKKVSEVGGKGVIDSDTLFIKDKKVALVVVKCEKSSIDRIVERRGALTKICQFRDDLRLPPIIKIVPIDGEYKKDMTSFLFFCTHDTCRSISKTVEGLLKESVSVYGRFTDDDDVAFVHAVCNEESAAVMMQKKVLNLFSFEPKKNWLIEQIGRGSIVRIEPLGGRYEKDIAAKDKTEMLLFFSDADKAIKLSKEVKRVGWDDIDEALPIFTRDNGLAVFPVKCNEIAVNYPGPRFARPGAS